MIRVGHNQSKPRWTHCWVQNNKIHQNTTQETPKKPQMSQKPKKKMTQYHEVKVRLENWAKGAFLT